MEWVKKKLDEDSSRAHNMHDHKLPRGTCRLKMQKGRKVGVVIFDEASEDGELLLGKWNYEQTVWCCLRNAALEGNE